MSAPDRAAVEHALDQRLLDWQWNTLLGILGHLPTSRRELDTAARAAGGSASARAQDAVKHTCELCGRQGTRRYVQTATGWRCAPSATKCRRIQSQPPAAASDIPAKPFQPNVTPPPPAASESRAKPETPQVTDHADAECNIRGRSSTPNVALPDRSSITARCQDCTRAFTLTGRVLRQAVEMHEHKHGHIVDVIGGKT